MRSEIEKGGLISVYITNGNDIWWWRPLHFWVDYALFDNLSAYYITRLHKSQLFQPPRLSTFISIVLIIFPSVWSYHNQKINTLLSFPMPGIYWKRKCLLQKNFPQNSCNSNIQALLILLQLIGTVPLGATIKSIIIILETGFRVNQRVLRFFEFKFFVGLS